MTKITIVGILGHSGNTNQINCDYFGIFIDIQSTDYHTTLIISDSNFHNVNVHHILKAVLYTVSSRITLWIKNCKFQYNNNTHQLQRSAVIMTISYNNVTVLFTNCLFYKNKNRVPLIYIQVIKYIHYNDSVDHEDYCLFPSNIQIKHTNFIENWSPLVDIQAKHNSKCITYFSITGPFVIMKNHGMGRDLIRIYNIAVKISGEAIFSYNTFARNIIIFHICTVTFYKNVSFIMNGFNAPFNVDHIIILLSSDLAYIKVMENTNIKFTNS